MPNINALHGAPVHPDKRMSDRHPDIRLKPSFWAAIVLGAAMILWSTLRLPFVTLETKMDAPNPGDDGKHS